MKNLKYCFLCFFIIGCANGKNAKTMPVNQFGITKSGNVETIASQHDTIKGDVYNYNFNSLDKPELIEMIKDKDKRIDSLEKELKEIKTNTAPNTIQLYSQSKTNIASGISWILSFEPLKNEPLGQIEFDIFLPIETKAQITDFWPNAAAGPFIAGDKSKTIAPDGKSARLIYSLMGAGYPTIEIKLSQDSPIKIKGNYCQDEITLE